MASSAQRCTSCGLPLGGVACASCGGGAQPLALADGDATASAHAAPPDRAGLSQAHAAWEAGDAASLIAECAKAAGATDLRVDEHADGPIVRALFHSRAFFAQARGDGGLTIETPIARLPATQYVPALRLLLELSDGDAAAVRFSVRGELVLGRFSGRVMGAPPPTLTAIFERLDAAAADAARYLAGPLGARPISPDEHAVMSLEAPRARPAPSPAASVETSLVQRLDSMPPLAAPAPRSLEPTPATGDLLAGDLPPVLGGRTGRASSASTSALKAPKAETKRSAEHPAAGGLRPSAEPTQLSNTPGRLRSPLRTPEPPPPNEPPARTLVSEAGSTPPKKPAAAGFGIPSLVDPNVDPLGDTFIGAKSAGSKPAGPGQGLSDLLLRAQALGVALSFADQPATMCLLIRATLYQAILDHGAAVPGAVAKLAADTVDQTREIYITAPGKRRGAMAIPAASPAFEAMASIVEQSSEIAVDVPLSVTPITTSQDAKQHLARYVSEIDQAPRDVDIRQFLAVGAVAELLVRTKLPPGTQEQLRKIVSHAKTEGPKQAVVDLILTALTRMMA